MCLRLIFSSFICLHVHVCYCVVQDLMPFTTVFRSIYIYIYIYMSRPARTNIMASAYCIDPDQPKHAAQAFPDRHFSAAVDFLFQESLIYTSIPLKRNVSARISLRGLRRLILVDTLRRGHNDGFLAGRLICCLSTQR